MAGEVEAEAAVEEGRVGAEDGQDELVTASTRRQGVTMVMVHEARQLRARCSFDHLPLPRPPLPPPRFPPGPLALRS